MLESARRGRFVPAATRERRRFRDSRNVHDSGAFARRHGPAARRGPGRAWGAGAGALVSLLLCLGAASLALAGEHGCPTCDARPCRTCLLSCPRCGEKVCRTYARAGKQEKHCWEIECREVCIPAVRFPWEARACGIDCDGCRRPGCLKGKCGRVRVVRALKGVDYECDACEYEHRIECVCGWMPCDACASAVTGPPRTSGTSPASNAPAASEPRSEPPSEPPREPQSGPDGAFANPARPSPVPGERPAPEDGSPRRAGAAPAPDDGQAPHPVCIPAVPRVSPGTPADQEPAPAPPLDQRIDLMHFLRRGPAQR